jgi:ABC-2 type transport system permease protein
MNAAKSSMNPQGLAVSFRRIAAMVRRYWYLIIGSWPRIAELAYWPTIQMVLWGFVSSFFMTQSSNLAVAAGALIGGVLLWDTLFRGQIGLSICFFEEMWSRNLGHLFVSPLRPWEMVTALMTMSLIRTVLGAGAAAVLAIFLYSFNLFALGLPLVAFFACLMLMSWGMGLVVVSMVLRYGLGAESLAWVAIFAFAPISAVYYPVEILPFWLQPVAWATPSAHVFEGMRQVLTDGTFAWGHLGAALALDVVYVGIGIAVFVRAFAHARAEGKLLQVGE